MGSRSNTDLAYIAGFLDGDGSLMLQLKKRKDAKRKLRFMCTICLYQDSRHDKPLHWMRKIFKIGYISKRNDGMSELRINGFKQVGDILSQLKGYLKFKKIQAQALYKAARILEVYPINNLSESKLRQLVDLMIIIQDNNYITKAKKSRQQLLELLNLTP